ncbi:hypothetical protein C1I98_36140, partial [Spongiactinospora gelatinilytica]
GGCEARPAKAFGAWAEAEFSGSVAVLTDGKPTCLAAYGQADDRGRPNTPGTVFDIGSITKAFTAAAVFRLIDKGRLALDDRAGDLLPALRGPVAAATVRQLLLHESGLTGTHAADDAVVGKAAAIAAIGDLDIAFRPGTGHQYSNAGYTLLALIVDEVSGMGFRDHLTAEVLRLPGGKAVGGFWNGEPAVPGPRALGVFDNGKTGDPGGPAEGPHWAMDGNGGLAMTAGDLAQWTHTLFTGGLVTPASAKAIAAPGHDLGGGRSETPGWVATSAEVFGEPFLAAAGGGGESAHNAMVAWVPGRRMAVAVLSNRPEVTAEDLLTTVGPALLTGRPLPVPRTTARPADGEQTAIVGTYRLPTGGSFQVSANARGPAVTAVGADAVAALFPPGPEPGADALRAHERAVLGLLAGRTKEGRKERAALRGTLGPIGGIVPAGTLHTAGELRTYVRITAGGRQVTGWWSVGEHGGVSAAEVPSPPPVLRLVPAGDGYRPDDPAGKGSEVTVRFGGDRMTIARGPGGTSVAERTG